MASVKLIPEEEATGKVKLLYDEIKSELGTDFIPNLYRAMASNPDYLEANWRKVKAIMFESLWLDRRTKEIIAVAVSAVNPATTDWRSTLPRCGARDGRRGDRGTDGRRRPVRRPQQAYGRLSGRARREALVRVRIRDTQSLRERLRPHRELGPESSSNSGRWRRR